jgi:SAM-dependent methyltransferase
MRMYFASYYRWLVIRDWVKTRATDRVLDVGCNDGEIVAQLKADLRVGLDLQPHCPDESVRLTCGDARRLPLAGHSFDTIFAFDVIEHIDDDRAVLHELVRVLAQGGTLWLSTPSAGFHIFPRFLTARANRGWGHVRNGYTLAELRQKLPPGLVLEVLEWNEPALRFMHVFLRVLDDVSPAITHALAGLCFRLDKRFSAGPGGHWFVRIRPAF